MVSNLNEKLNDFLNINIDDSSDLLEHKNSISIIEKAYEVISKKENVINFDIKI